jgi:hypothetical protein
MKSLIGILLCAMMQFMVTEDKQETTDLALAKVDKISGKYIFLNAEPVAEYDVAFMVEIKVVWDNSQINSLDKITNLVLNKAFKTAEKEDKEFDALIIKSGQKQDLAIKFKQ